MHSTEVPFQKFYSFVTVKLDFCNNLKFWLVCEAALSFGKAIIGLQLLCRAIYYDFFEQNAPYKATVEGSTAKKIRVCLVENCDANVEGLLRTAQVDIGHQLLGTSDLRCIYDLVIAVCSVSERDHSATGESTDPSGVAVCHSKSIAAHLKTASRDSCNAPDNTVFQEVNHCLSRVQKERELCLKGAQDKACDEGKEDTTVAWYDFSGCKTKYQMYK